MDMIWIWNEWWDIMCVGVGHGDGDGGMWEWESWICVSDIMG